MGNPQGQKSAEEFRQMPIGKVLLVYKHVQKSMEQRLPEGLSPTQGKTICVLSAHGPMNQRQLGEHLSLEPATVARALDGLETRGLLKRQPHPQDRRAFLLHLTEDGAALFPGLYEHIQAVNRLAVSPLSSEEQATLGELLDRVAASLMAETDPCPCPAPTNSPNTGDAQP